MDNGTGYTKLGYAGMLRVVFSLTDYSSLHPIIDDDQATLSLLSLFPLVLPSTTVSAQHLRARLPLRKVPLLSAPVIPFPTFRTTSQVVSMTSTFSLGMRRFRHHRITATSNRLNS
jgi:hypothetical protein